MEFVNLKMNPALRDRLKIIAAKEKRSMVSQVEHWIKHYEEEEMFRPPHTAEELLRMRKANDKAHPRKASVS